MELSAFGEQVFQADYIQKKRHRRGKVEYLVKWKGYSVKQSTWEPTDNILDTLLIAEFDSKREEWRKKQRLLRKKRKLRLTSAENLSDSNDSDQDEEDAGPPAKRQAPSQENLWPYLPSDRLPTMWGSPPRALRQQKVKEKLRGHCRMEENNLREGKRCALGESNGSKKSRRYRPTEKNEKRGGNNHENDDEAEEDEDEGVEDNDDDDKWSSPDCWEVKSSSTVTSSPGESNVLRVHRVRSDVDYVERGNSPCSDSMSDSTDSTNNINNNNNNTSTANNNDNNNRILKCNNTDLDEHHNCQMKVNGKTAQDLRNHNMPPTHINTNSNSTFSQNKAQGRCTVDEDIDDWNFGSQFHKQVNNERKRLEAQILKEDLEREQGSNTMVEASNGSSFISTKHLQHSHSYSRPDQYHHKKLHHAKRRHTMDSPQKITITDVDCHKVKITFLESNSDNGFFKSLSEVRT